MVWVVGFSEIFTFLHWEWTVSSGKVHPIVYYFRIVRVSMNVILSGLFFKMLLNADRFSRMFMVILNSKLLKTSKKQWAVFACLYGSWIVSGLTGSIFGEYVSMYGEGHKITLYRAHVRWGRYSVNFKIKPDFENQGESMSVTQYEEFLALFSFIKTSAKCIQKTLIQSLFGMCCATIWVAASRFIELANKKLIFSCGTKHTFNMEQLRWITNRFQELRELVDTINSEWSQFCLWVLLDIVIWSAADLDFAFHSNDRFHVVKSNQFLLLVGISIVLSAESFRKVLPHTTQHLETI